MRANRGRNLYRLKHTECRIRPCVNCRPLLVLLLLALPSCSYFSNRGRDFLEIFRLQGGFGRGLGVTARAAGLLDIGLNTPGAFYHSSGVGAVYGDLYFLSDDRVDVDFMRIVHDEQLGVADGGEMAHSHKCWAVLPGFFARIDRVAGPDYPDSADYADWLDGPMLWSERALEIDPWAHVHAFDAELGVYLLVANAKAGLSPGEAADFLVGLVGLDLAGDDTGSGNDATSSAEEPE